MAKELKDLTKRADDYSQWYNELVVKADLAEQSPVRGCMVIKPMAMLYGKKCSRLLIKCSRKQVFKTHIFLYSFRNLFFAVKLNM